MSSKHKWGIQDSPRQVANISVSAWKKYLLTKADIYLEQLTQDVMLKNIFVH